MHELRTVRDDAVSLTAARAPFELPAVTHRLLGSKGFRSDEAGNLTAYLQGIAPVTTGWALGEIERLLFLRHLVERGDLGSRGDIDPIETPKGAR